MKQGNRGSNVGHRPGRDAEGRQQEIMRWRVLVRVETAGPCGDSGFAGKMWLETRRRASEQRAEGGGLKNEVSRIITLLLRRYEEPSGMRRESHLRNTEQALKDTRRPYHPILPLSGLTARRDGHDRDKPADASVKYQDPLHAR